ncbi:hypothetical protein L0222_21245 [bacterium]|nr:hypothetical protein [bacterium]MCI0606076.1 hypothetical protein [bacterium]
MNCKIVFAFLVFLTAAACNDDDGVGSNRVESLPANFKLEAQASGTDSEGTTVDCRLDFTFELRSETFRDANRVVYKGVHGGEAFRRILDEQGNGFAFFADAFGEMEAHLNIRTGATALIAPVNETASNQFWRELARFDVTMNRNGTGRGTWTCAPLEIDQGGYVDNSISVDGVFRIEPIQAN